MLFGRRLHIDVVIAHTSVPVDGKVSLGLEVNVIPAAIEACKASGGVVIAQMNPQVPYTFGDGEYDLDVFDAVIEVEEPVLTHQEPERDLSLNAGGMTREEGARIIGGYISERVNDGATVQMGIGDIPDAALNGLLGKRNLGIWSEVISDGVLELERAGALDPNRPIVSSIVYGGADLYKWVHLNDRVRMLRTETTNAPQLISANPGYDQHQHSLAGRPVRPGERVAHQSPHLLRVRRPDRLHRGCAACAQRAGDHGSAIVAPEGRHFNRRAPFGGTGDLVPALRCRHRAGGCPDRRP